MNIYLSLFIFKTAIIVRMYQHTLKLVNNVTVRNIRNPNKVVLGMVPKTKHF